MPVHDNEVSLGIPRHDGAHRPKVKRSSSCAFSKDTTCELENIPALVCGAIASLYTNERGSDESVKKF